MSRVSTDMDTFLKTANNAAARTALGVGSLVVETAAIFLSKAGNDSNPGTSIDKPKLTLASAVTAATALSPTITKGVRIEITDGGEYTETSGAITIPSYVHVVGPAASYVGRILINNNASFTIGNHYALNNNHTLVNRGGTGTGGMAVYKANIVDGRGKDQNFTGTKCIQNTGTFGFNLRVDVGLIFVAATNGVNLGIGIGSSAAENGGHVHAIVSDLYLAGNGAIGIYGSASGPQSANIVGFIDHILETATFTGTIGIWLDHADAEVKIVVAEIVADTAYLITAGDLYIACPKIVGTQTGTAVRFVTGAGTGITDPSAFRVAIELEDPDGNLPVSGIALGDSSALIEAEGVLSGDGAGNGVIHDGHFQGGRTLVAHNFDTRGNGLIVTADLDGFLFAYDICEQFVIPATAVVSGTQFRLHGRFDFMFAGANEVPVMIGIVPSSHLALLDELFGITQEGFGIFFQSGETNAQVHIDHVFQLGGSPLQLQTVGTSLTHNIIKTVGGVMSQENAIGYSPSTQEVASGIAETFSFVVIIGDGSTSPISNFLYNYNIKLDVVV